MPKQGTIPLMNSLVRKGFATDEGFDVEAYKEEGYRVFQATAQPDEGDITFSNGGWKRFIGRRITVNPNVFDILITDDPIPLGDIVVHPRSTWEFRLKPVTGDGETSARIQEGLEDSNGVVLTGRPLINNLVSTSNNFDCATATFLEPSINPGQIMLGKTAGTSFWSYRIRAVAHKNTAQGGICDGATMYIDNYVAIKAPLSTGINQTNRWTVIEL